MTEYTPAKKVSPREAFLHLLAILTLYGSAVSLVTLLFQYINILIPDPLFTNGYLPSYREPLRFSISSLIVVFPVFMVVSWFLNKSYLGDLMKRELRLRKWLVYFTLFAAALIMIGDLVALVYNLLGGEVTVRFMLKALALLLTVGAIFWYYLADVRRQGPMKSMKRFVWGVSLAVGVAVVGGFFLVGSPQEERLRKFDDQRVSDLQNIQWQILPFWQKKERLPESLAELTDELSGYRPPLDPEPKRGMPYEYRSLPVRAGRGPTFELCATFNRPSRTVPGAAPKAVRPEYGPSGEPFVGDVNWEHPEGRACFTRTIDPERYQPPEKFRRPPVD